MTTDFLLTKFDRLRKRADYLHLSAVGKKIHTEHFLIVWSWEVVDRRRLGLTVSKKVGKAVVRNQLKRLLREYFRLNKVFFEKADYNIIAKKGADRLSLQDISLELEKALLKIKSSFKC